MCFDPIYKFSVTKQSIANLVRNTLAQESGLSPSSKMQSGTGAKLVPCTGFWSVSHILFVESGDK